MATDPPERRRRTLLPDDGQAVVRRAGEVAADLIRAAILRGDLGPGERLKEGALARDLGISRTPIREALLILQGEGLIDSSPNRGAVVRDYTQTELRDIYELRAHLESYAARRAATRIDEQRLEALRESCQRFGDLRADGKMEELTGENLRFHYGVAEAAESPRLMDFIRGAIEVPLVNRSFFMFSAAEADSSERHHRAITSALEARDPERAELLMKEHIFEGRDFLVAHLREYRTGTRAPDAGS